MVQRLMVPVPVILCWILLSAVPAAATQEPIPAQEPVRLAIEQGKKLLEDGKIDKAREKFHKARKAGHDQAPAAFVGLAEVELKLDNLERALQHVDKALELVRDPTSKAEILNLKGIILFAYVRRPLPAPAATTAEPSQTEAHGLEELEAPETALDPDEATTARFKREIQARRARAANAEPYFREALELSGGALNSARLNLAEALQKQGMKEESREILQEYLRRADSDDDVAAGQELLSWLDRAPQDFAGADLARDASFVAPRKVRGFNPSYTPLARKERAHGVVIADVIIDREGNVVSVKVVKGLPYGLSEETVKTLKTWKYEPAIYDGDAVSVSLRLTTTFSLD